MCGIFGAIAPSDLKNINEVISKFTKLMIHSESRGKDASGITLLSQDGALIIKSRDRGKKLIRSGIYREKLIQFRENNKSDRSVLLAGHTRMVTHGNLQNIYNNQPCVAGARFIVFHNGIITNWKNLSEKLKIVDAEELSDTQIFARIIEQSSNDLVDVFKFIDYHLREVMGANNFTIIDSFSGEVYFYTTNGSLYVAINKRTKVFFYASERNILSKSLGWANDMVIIQLPKSCLVTAKSALRILEVDNPDQYMLPANLPIFESQPECESLMNRITSKVSEEVEEISLLSNSIDYTAIKNLKRCTICVLPVTFPRLKFDNDGVCELCHSFKPVESLGKSALSEKLKRHQGKVLVPLSGGRDSVYALHYIVKELGMSPIAYTYDWGFVSNSARENISKVCGTLGIEHILIAADIKRKRQNVRKNLDAWLRNPRIGMIPILMAGDKQFLTLGEKIKKENRLGTSIFAMNRYEKTLFKSAFAGSDFSLDIKRLHGVSLLNRGKIATYYLQNIMFNRRYWNSSLWDSVIGFFSFYFVNPNYVQIYDYIDWDESTINSVIEKEYGFNSELKRVNAWRSGDSTSGFYNYLYLRYAGFTENDTFRSNQIRDGKLTRQEALHLIASENAVQTQMIVEYLNSINYSLADFNRKISHWGQYGA